MVWNPQAFSSAVDFSPLLRAVQGYRQGMDSAAEYKTQQAVGGRIAAGDWAGAQAEGAKGGMELPSLLSLAQRAREDDQRRAQAAALERLKSNPGLQSRLTPEFAASLEALPPDQRAAQMADVTNPITRQKLEIQREQMRRQAMDQYGKAGTIVQAADGTFYTVQFGSNGQKIVAPLMADGKALTPAKGVDTVGDTLIDKSTGQVVRQVGPNLQEGERAKAVGREVGEAGGKAVTGIGRAEANATQMLDLIEKARTHPGRGAGTGPIGGRLPAVGGDQAGFVALMDQMQGKAFLEAFESLKGGGAITQIEGQKATDAIARLNRVQNPRDFDAALNDLRDVVAVGLERARASAQAVPRGQAPQAAPQAPAAAPAPGTIMQGYRFKGGNPGDPNSWERAQ